MLGSAPLLADMEAMKPTWLPLLALVLVSCRHDPVQVAAPDTLAYPTFEAATSSRMFPLLAGDLEKVDLAAMKASLDRLDVVSGAHGEARRFTDQLSPPDPRLRQGPSAELLPKLEPQKKIPYAFAPIVLMKLEPLWSTPTWSEEQVQLANHGASILARVAGAPTPVFALGDHGGNRAGLEQLVRWYDAAVAKPEVLAATIFTLDNGPFIGLPYATESLLPDSQRLRVDELLELRLAKVERDGEPWVMQCVRDGKLAWSRVVSGLPDGEVEDVEFVDVSPIGLGEYGWHVPFKVSWTYGGVEQAHLYLDPAGELRFYFLSW